MKAQILTVFVVLLASLRTANGVFVSQMVQGHSQICYSDDIPRHTLIKIDIKTPGSFLFEFKEGMFVVASEQILNMGFTKSFTTQRYGTHHFCFLNRQDQADKISLQIAIGKYANDYGSAVGADLFVGTLQNQAKIANQFVQQIVQENTQGLEIMVAEAKEKFSFITIYIFSAAFVICSLILSAIQHKMIRKHLHARKYI